MSGDRLFGGHGAAPLWLDALAFGRALFEPGREDWFDPAALLGVARQTRQALAPDVLALPLLPWLRDWWTMRRGAPPTAARPARALRAAFEDAALRRELTEALAALGATGPVALHIDGPSEWLCWAGGAPGPVEDIDGEDVFSYLAALLHTLPADAAAAVLLHGLGSIEGCVADACAPLCNAARHLGWRSVQCAGPGEAELAGVDACALDQPLPGRGWHAAGDIWRGLQAAPEAVAFICSSVPADASVQQVRAVLATLRP